MKLHLGREGGNGASSRSHKLVLSRRSRMCPGNLVVSMDWVLEDDHHV